MKTFVYDITKKSLNKKMGIKDFKIIESKKTILIQLFSGEDTRKIKNHLKDIQAIFPHATIIGATSDGEIIQKEITTKSTIISISAFEDTTLNAKHINSGDSFKNGSILAKELVTSKTKLLITFTNGLLSNGEEFLKGINSVAPSIVVAGGLAGDNAEFKECNVISNYEIFNNGIVAVALDSDILKVQNSYNFGWEPFGMEHTITKSKLNRVYEINNIKTVDFFAKYLGEDIKKELPGVGIEFPLIIQRDGISTARAVTKKHDDGSLSFAGNFNENERVHLGLVSEQKILKDITSEFKNTPVESFFIYSCMARRHFLNEEIYKEIKPFSQIATTAGFYTYGEFYTSNKAELLNQTLTVVSLSETNEIHHTIMQKKELLTSQEKTSNAISHLRAQITKEYKELNNELNKKVAYEAKNSNALDIILSSLYDTMLEGFVICNSNKQIIQINNSLAKLLEYSKEELLKMSLSDLVIEEHRHEIEKCLNENLNSSRSEVTFTKKNGEALSTLINSSPILYHGTQVHLTTIIDLSDIKAKDSQLMQQSKLAQMGEMINMIAHQWRQPLNAISAASIKLNMQSELDIITYKEIQKTTAFIEKMSLRMSQTIDDFMNLTKPKHEKKIVKIIDIIKEIRGIIDSQLIAHYITLEIDCDKDISLMTQTTELTHVLLNVIINARDALDEIEQKDKKIKIVVKNQSNGCEIVISDNAKGIPQENLKRLFEQYFTTKLQGKGTGLGLYMSKKIITEVLNGDVSVANNSNHGAEFTINLKDC